MELESCYFLFEPKYSMRNWEGINICTKLRKNFLYSVMSLKGTKVNSKTEISYGLE